MQFRGLWARVEEISDLKYASVIKHACVDKVYKQKVYFGPMGFIKICRVKGNFWSIDVPTDGSRFMKKLLLLSERLDCKETGVFMRLRFVFLFFFFFFFGCRCF